METIIGLLVILVPVIFKLIGKKLEAAQQEQSKQSQSPEEWAEVLRRHIQMPQDPELEELLKEAPTASEAMRTQQMKQVQGKKKTESKPAPVKKASPILKEEVKKPKEKIDPKKLIVYSEIMKPKCND